MATGLEKVIVCHPDVDSSVKTVEASFVPERL